MTIEQVLGKYQEEKTAYSRRKQKEYEEWLASPEGIAEQKREIAFFDKITLENRKQMMDAERTKRINSILEIKRKEKERRSQNERSNDNYQ